MLGELIPCGGGAPIRLHRPILVVGRHSDCDITIGSKAVSGRHCELLFSEGCWSVRDLSSKNGTFVNGERCSSRKLDPDDRLAFGRNQYRIRWSTLNDQPLQEVLANLLDEPPKRPAQPDVKPDAQTVSVPRNASSPKASPAPLSTDTASGTQTPSPNRLLGKLIPGGGGDPIPLLESPLTFGRARECQIRLKQPTVSSRHCKLEFKDGYWFVTDLGSRNGIRIDGVPQESGYLMPDSILSVARFRFQIHYRPTGDAPPPEADIFSVSLLEKAGLAKTMEATKLPRWAEMDDAPAKPRYEIQDVESDETV